MAGAIKNVVLWDMRHCSSVSEESAARVFRPSSRTPVPNSVESHPILVRPQSKCCAAFTIRNPSHNIHVTSASNLHTVTEQWT
jgi:hypothetical protein